MMKPAISVLMAGSLLAGCATMHTTSIGENEPGGEGAEYFLPSGYFDLEIYEAKGQVSVVLGGPHYLPDYAARLRTKLLPGGGADNDFTVVLQGGLLNSVKGSSDGKVKEIVTSATKSAFGILTDGGEIRENDKFFGGTYRFDELEKAQKEANSKLVEFLAARCPQAAKDDDDCKLLEQSIPTSNRGKFIKIELTAVSVGLVKATQGSNNKRSLSVLPGDALAYRPLVPVSLVLSTADGRQASETFAVPDETRTSWVRAPAGLFANQEYDFTFENGTLKSYKRVARNEVVGLVSLPLEIAKSIISAPAALLGSRGELLKDQAEYLKQVSAFNAAVAQARNDCAKQGSICDSSVYHIIGVRTPNPAQDDTSKTQSPKKSSGDNSKPDDGGDL